VNIALGPRFVNFRGSLVEWHSERRERGGQATVQKVRDRYT
jgi:hypothetical protein